MNKLTFKSIVLLIVMLLLVACSKGENASQEQPGNESGTPERPEGVELELIGVGEAARPVFERNLDLVEKGHRQMIYRKTEKTKELFHKDRPDLKSAKLTYNADNNQVLFTFFYSPQPSDLLFTAESPAMVIDVAAYLYIQNTLRAYLQKVTLELKEQNIHMQSPRISYMFFNTEDEYMYIEFPPFSRFQAYISVKPKGDPTESTMDASFATGTLVMAVAKPNMSVKGENSSEAALLRYFNIPYEKLFKTNHSASSDEVPEEIETPLDHADGIKATNSLKFTSKKHGFTIQLPSSWKGRYAVKEGDWMEDVRATYDFIFIDRDEVISSIFSIIVSDLSKEEFMDYYEGSFVQYITSNEQYTIGYSIPGEPPLELLENEERQPLLDELMQMVNEDVPKIVDSLEVK